MINKSINQSTLFNEGDTKHSVTTDKPVVPQLPDRIGIWKFWFFRRGENRSTGEKPLGTRTRTNNKLNPHITPSPGIEPGPHWWEASALTTAPSLLPLSKIMPSDL